VEAKDIMKIQLLIIGITLVLITLGLSGCTNNNFSSKSNEEKLLGEWNVREINANATQYIATFLSNNSVKATFPSGQESWDTYAITDQSLKFTKYGGGTTFEYSFSDNDNKLTLIADWGQTLILTRK
jgi:hypothetical protein